MLHLSVDTNLEINGGTIKAISKESNGIYANNLKIENAQIEAEDTILLYLEMLLYLFQIVPLMQLVQVISQSLQEVIFL